MNYRADDFYPPRNEDWKKKPYEPQDPRIAEHWKKPITPKPVSLSDLFPRMDRWGIGILDSLESLKTIADAKPSYPPYNIIRDKALGGRWEISLAVAGFRKNELEVIAQQGVLTIRTNPDVDFEGDDIREVIHQGIAQRNFELKFALAEHVEVKSADLKDGILRVILEQKLPKEKQPKQIEIQ